MLLKSSRKTLGKLIEEVKSLAQIFSKTAENTPAQ